MSYDPRKGIGRRMRLVREALSISQAEAAGRSGIGLRTLRKYENGGEPMTKQFLDFAHAFNSNTPEKRRGGP
jgi:transcriptional regulator with XRE-family HTH domain